MKTEHRTIEVRIETDEERRGPGVLRGVLLTYDEVASDRAELFEPGSLSWPSNGIVLNEQHNRQAPITRVIPEVRGDKVVVDTALPDTQRARDLKTLIDNKTLTGMSVEFFAVNEEHRNGVRRIQKAELVRGAVVDSASYKGSTVEVRDRGRRSRRLWL